MLHGVTTPEVFCAKLMEISNEIEHIAVVVTFKETDNGPASTSVFHTAMKNDEKAWVRWVFDQDFRPET